MTIAIPTILICAVLAWVLRPGMHPTRLRKQAILSTVGPPLATTVLAIIFQLLDNVIRDTWMSSAVDTLFFATIGLVVLSLLSLLGFIIKRGWAIAKAIGFGLCLCFIILILDFGILEWLAGV